MGFIIPLLGISILSYVMYLVIGLGIAIATFIGLALIMVSIFTWFMQTNRNLEALFHQGAADFSDLNRAINRIQK